MLSPARALHQVVFDTLDGDAALATELGGSGRIHAGRAPKKAPFPHITFGTQFSGKWDTHDKDGNETLFEVNVWVRSRNWTKATDVRVEVDRILGEVDLDLTADGFSGTALGSFEDAVHIEDPEENIRRIVLQYRYNISET